MIIISEAANTGCDALVDALRAEFGGILAERIVEAEAADFLWESRVRERYLGQHIGATWDDEPLSEDVARIAVLSAMDGKWHVGVCLVDGEGTAVDLLWKQSFARSEEAEYAFVHAR